MKLAIIPSAWLLPKPLHQLLAKRCCRKRACVFVVIAQGPHSHWCWLVLFSDRWSGFWLWVTPTVSLHTWMSSHSFLLPCFSLFQLPDCYTSVKNIFIHAWHSLCNIWLSVWHYIFVPFCCSSLSIKLSGIPGHNKVIFSWINVGQTTPSSPSGCQWSSRPKGHLKIIEKVPR